MTMHISGALRHVGSMGRKGLGPRPQPTPEPATAAPGIAYALLQVPWPELCATIQRTDEPVYGIPVYYAHGPDGRVVVYPYPYRLTEV